MYDRLGWMTVNQLVRYHTLLAVFRIRTTKEPEYLADSLCNDSRNGRIMIQKTRLSLALSSFRWRGACQWNVLPADIRALTKIGIFKKKIKTWIKQNVPRFLD